MNQAPSGQPPRRGLTWRWGDVARSVVVLLAIVGVIALYQAALSGGPSRPTPRIDYTAAARSARADAGYPILVPARLPDGWQVTSVRYAPGSRWAWHVGVVTAGDEYVGLEQAPVAAESLIDSAAKSTAPAGATRIDGAVWQLRRDESRGETTLVRRANGVTTLVTGSASEDTLVAYVDSLRPAEAVSPAPSG